VAGLADDAEGGSRRQDIGICNPDESPRSGSRRRGRSPRKPARDGVRCCGAARHQSILAVPSPACRSWPPIWWMTTGAARN